jgi:hypothetical protein
MVQSKVLFKQITNLEHDADWEINERKVIHYAFLRSAQLEEHSNVKTEIIKQAIHFDENIDVDEKIFPPPLVKLYNNLRKLEVTNIWPLPKESQDYNVLLINGKRQLNKSSFIKSSSGTKRFSFISNTFKPVHLIIDPSNLQVSSLPKVEIVSGTCQKPQLQFNKYPVKNFILLDENCIKKINGNSIETNIAEVNISSTKQVPNNNSLFKNKWFWIGASVLVTGIIYSGIKNNQRSTNSPEIHNEIATFTNE